MAYIHSRPVSGTFYQGDTIPAFSIEFDSGDGIDLTGAQIRMQVYWNNNKVIDVSVGNGITIDSSLKFTIDERAYTEQILPAGTGIGDIEITIDGKRTTYLQVEYEITKHRTV